MVYLPSESDVDVKFWVAINGISLKCWQDGCIAYQSLSGETHLLSHDMARLFSLLQSEGSTSEQELLTGLAVEAVEPNFPDILGSWLQRLSEAHLICRHRP